MIPMWKVHFYGFQIAFQSVKRPLKHITSASCFVGGGATNRFRSQLQFILYCFNALLSSFSSCFNFYFAPILDNNEKLKRCLKLEDNWKLRGHWSRASNSSNLFRCTSNSRALKSTRVSDHWIVTKQLTLTFFSNSHSWRLDLVDRSHCTIVGSRRRLSGSFQQNVYKFVNAWSTVGDLFEGDPRPLLHRLSQCKSRRSFEDLNSSEPVESDWVES